MVAAARAARARRASSAVASHLHMASGQLTVPPSGGLHELVHHESETPAPIDTHARAGLGLGLGTTAGVACVAGVACAAGVAAAAGAAAPPGPDGLPEDCPPSPPLAHMQSLAASGPQTPSVHAA